MVRTKNYFLIDAQICGHIPELLCFVDLLLDFFAEARIEFLQMFGCIAVVHFSRFELAFIMFMECKCVRYKVPFASVLLENEQSSAVNSAVISDVK